MSGSIYSKPIAFAILATAVIMVGTLVTTFLPIASDQMHPKLDGLRPFSPLELAGRDIYQREGCVNCHTQTVRPLKAEVMRYGEYSKAGEFAYDRPFLWGSKRTGPDLARIGGKYPDEWHYLHFDDPQSVAKGSNMPVYGWMKGTLIDPREVRAHMDALGLPYTDEDMRELEGKDEVDAMVAYLQSLGHAVKKAPVAISAMALEEQNPYTVDAAFIHRGEEIYEAQCEMCHGDDGEGGIAPALMDDIWLGKAGRISDGAIKAIISGGTEPGKEIAGRKAQGGMPPFADISDENLWALVSYIRSEGSSDPRSLGSSDPRSMGSSELRSNESADSSEDDEAWDDDDEHADIDGAALYAQKCAACHGAEAQGGFGPRLTDKQWVGRQGDISDEEIVGIVTTGRPDKGMPAFSESLGHEGIEAVVRHIRSIAN